MRVGTLLQFIGGGIGRAAVTGIVTAIFILIVGLNPAQFFAAIMQNPPALVHSWVFSATLLVVATALIGGSLWYNLWSRKQICIDQVGEQLAWAIHNLLNKPPKPNDAADLARWWGEVVGWEAKVSRLLENRAFFTRADQLHFDVLGFVNPVNMTGLKDADLLLSQLKMKFDRLRDVINWAQMRR